MKQRLGLILAQEETSNVDWGIVQRLCNELSDEIGHDAPVVVKDYLANPSRRRADPVFAHGQRSELAHFLRSQ
jgi:hypothetical protein